MRVDGQAYIRSTSDLFTVETGATESYSFDQSACLVRAAWDGMMCRWGLDGSCLIKERQPFGKERKRRLLSANEGLELATSAYAQATQLLGGVDAQGQAVMLGSAWRQAVQALQEQGCSPLRRRAADYQEIYSPVGILPPDQYGALVLQLTEGCRYNRCTFCTFYRDVPYRVKSAEDFARHIKAVQAMLGDALNRRRTVFLGDANALGIPFDELRMAFDVINHHLPLTADDPGGIEGIYTFMDVYGRRHKNSAEYSALAERGLRRVYIGVESGSTAVLRVLHKPEELDTLRSVIGTMKAGGVGVGLIFLLGAGGERHADIHATESASLLASLPLDSHDIVYFSELIIDPTSEYAAWAAAEGIVPLPEAAMRAQEKVIRQGLKPINAGGPRVTRYDVREFIYY